MRFESNGATRRLRQSKQRSAPGIPIFKGCASLSRTGRRSCGSLKTSNAAYSEAAMGNLCGNASYLLQEVLDLVGDAVVAIDSARPDLVFVRAKRRFSVLQPVHPASEVVLCDLARLAYVGDYGDRLVLAVFGLGDQHREAQVCAVLDLDCKSGRRCQRRALLCGFELGFGVSNASAQLLHVFDLLCILLCGSCHLLVSLHDDSSLQCAPEAREDFARTQRKKPPARRPAAWRRGARLLGDLVRPLPRLVLGGLDREAHFLGEVSADEAPDAVVLPVGGLGDLGHRRGLGAAQEVQDDALFRELAWHRGLLHFGGLLAGDLLLGLLLRRDLGLLGGFLRALVGLGRALLLAGSLLRDGLLRRDLRALFRNGGGFGGAGGFCVLHGGVYPFGG